MKITKKLERRPAFRTTVTLTDREVSCLVEEICKLRELFDNNAHYHQEVPLLHELALRLSVVPGLE